MRNYFDITEFLIDPAMRQPGAQVPVHVVQKIDDHHRPILNNIRDELGIPIIISKHSGYRPLGWEKSRGRSGGSQHTFAGKGAVDVRCEDNEVLLIFLKRSGYNRVCWYPEAGFIHCDYKPGPRGYFEADPDGDWTYKSGR